MELTDEILREALLRYTEIEMSKIPDEIVSGAKPRLLA